MLHAPDALEQLAVRKFRGAQHHQCNRRASQFQGVLKLAAEEDLNHEDAGASPAKLATFKHKSIRTWTFKPTSKELCVDSETAAFSAGDHFKASQERLRHVDLQDSMGLPPRGPRSHPQLVGTPHSEKD
eukprot:5831169-Amphidinium_carterae.1